MPEEDEVKLKFTADSTDAQKDIGDLSRNTDKNVKKLKKKWSELELAQKKLGLTTQQEKNKMVEAFNLVKKSGVSSAKEIRKAEERLNQTLGKTPSKLARIKKSLLSISGVVAGFSAFFLGKVFLNTIGNIEEAWIGVAKTTGLAGEEFERLKRRIRDLSLELKGVKLEELQTIAQTAGQLGIQGVRDITEFTRVVAMMAVATNLTAAEAAENFAQIANILKLPISEMETLGSVINELSNNSAANARQITNLTKRIGGAGQTVGLTAAEIVGLSATLIDLGIGVEKGGTAVSVLLLRMLTDTQKFADVTGTSMEEFAQLVGTKPVEALKLLLAELNKMDQFEAAKALDSLGFSGGRSAPIILKLRGGIEKLNEQLARANEETKKGTSLMNEYGTASQGLFAQTTSVTNALKVAADEIGENFLPVLKQMLPVILDIIDAFSRLGAGLIGTVQSVGAGLDFLSSAYFRIVQGMALVTDALGVTTEASEHFKTKAEEAAIAGEATFIKAGENITKLVKGMKEVEIPTDDITESLKEMGDAAEETTNKIVDAAEEAAAKVALSFEEQAKLDKKIQDLRIAGFRQTQSELEKTLSKGERDYKKYSDEVIALENKIQNARLTTEEKVRALRQSLLGPEQLFFDKRLQAEQALSKAKEAIARKDFETAALFAKKSQDLFVDLGQEVKKGEKVIVSESEAVRTAIRGVEEAGNTLNEVYEKQKGIAQESADTQLMANELIKADLDVITTKLKALEEQKTIHELELDSAEAESILDDIRRDTSSIHTIHVRKVEENSTGGPIRARTGRFFPGYGGGDRIPILGEAGEFMNRKESVAKYGAGLFHALNRMDTAGALASLGAAKFQDGGAVGAASTPEVRSEGVLKLVIDGVEHTATTDGNTFKALAAKTKIHRESRGDYRPPWENK